MSRKNRPHYHEPSETVPVGEPISEEVPVEDTLEVGAIMLVEEPLADGAVSTGTVFLADGPEDAVPLSVSEMIEPEDALEFGVVAEYEIPAEPDTNPYSAGGSLGTPDMEGESSGTPGDLSDTVRGVASGVQEKAADLQDKAQNITNSAPAVIDAVQDKAQDMAQNVSSTTQDLAGKAQDAAGTLSQKAQDAAAGIADKAQDTAQSVADKAKEAAQAIADKAAAAKTAAADTGKKSKGAVAGAAGTVGMGLWSIVQRSPLQAIVFLSSLIWLLRNNSATAAQTPVSVSDAAEKVGTISGQVQVAAGNLGSQVKTQAQAGAGWFSTTLQENPLVIGAMALVAGLGLGLAVPETSYENKALGKTRDQLLDKATEAASDLTQKVTTVAHSAVHEAVETAKTEAKNQGLAPQDEAPAEGQPGQSQQQ
jgi:uncharacterized protein YjbJ (UPF0337 family)